ncbi:unnamed protein product [Caenorhabditis bovis]|uniref:BCAS3 WD40 domain-containing protein n=1 Tax=Caenorhabditis bovis TaxID=2654633 RepID=A0A8S1EDM9_9PELO|nr:unnamed protein product [Caenorhabditis bovis]
MSSEDMPPNAHTVGGGKKKSKKEKNGGGGVTTNASMASASGAQAAPQTIPSQTVEKENKVVVEDVEIDLKNDRSTESLGDSCTNNKEHEICEKTIKAPIFDDTPIAPPRKKSHQNGKSAPPPPMAPVSCKPSPLPTREGAPQRQRNASISYNRGQVVRPSDPPSSTIVGSMAGIVQDVLPKTHSPSNSAPPVEKAEWVQMSSIEKAGNPRERLDVLVVGLARGYQIWTLNPNGEFEEVLSERQGPVRVCKILPNNVNVGHVRDPFAAQRPLMALVDASSHVPDRQYCSVQLLSLATGKEVHRLTFDEPITAINVSEQYLIVSLLNRVYAYEVVSFAEVRHLKTAAPLESSPPAVALSGQMLAYHDSCLNPDIQSSGGLAPDVEANTSEKYADQMMNMFSRTFKSIGDSVGATTSALSSKNGIAHGIVTIVDLATQAEESSDGVICHWIAHEDAISHIAFSPDQRLVVTGDSTANVFNVFLILPHPSSSTLAAVQHLYKLHRGNTPAKVTGIAFANDCRWLAVSTNHGTCHLFAVCPFGGKPSHRTHGEMFVNKESRFHRSAGLSDTADVTASLGPSKARAINVHASHTKEHPVAQMSKPLAKTNGNSRVGPFPPPLCLNAVKKIKDQRYSADNLTAWATDMTTLPLGTTGNVVSPTRRRIETPKITVRFASKPTKNSTSTPPMSLLVCRVDANAGGVVVCEYELRPRAGAVETEPPKLNVTPKGLWALQRTKNNADMHPPMPQGSPLIKLSAIVANQENGGGGGGGLRRGEEMWAPHVETRTFQPPTRWLWQGPQFEFYEYKEEDSAVLMSPNENRENRSSVSSFKSIPVVIGGDSANVVPSDATRIECGSYTSTNSYISSLNADAQGDIASKIADAMREITCDSPEPQPNDLDSIEEFYDTHSPSTERRDGAKSSKSAKKAPLCAPPPPPPPSVPPKGVRQNDESEDEDILDDFEMGDDDEEDL